MRCFVASLVFALCLLAPVAFGEDPINVPKKRTYKPFDAKFCVFEEKGCWSKSYAWNDDWTDSNTVYRTLFKCYKNAACTGVNIDARRGASQPTKQCTVKELDDSDGGNYYLRLNNKKRSCPTGSTLYEPPKDIYSHKFCKYQERNCYGKKVVYGKAISIRDYETCLQRCTNFPTCTGINFVLSDVVKNPCELLIGQCDADELSEMLYRVHYMRLAHGETECPAAPKTSGPYCNADEKEIISPVNSGQKHVNADCPENHFVSRCDCVQLSFIEKCDGVSINGHDSAVCTSFTGWSGMIKTRICCRPLPEGHGVLAKDNAADVDSDYRYTVAPVVECPAGTDVATCTLHSTDGLSPDQHAEKQGNTCTSPESYGKVRVQAICTGPDNQQKKLECGAGEQLVGAEGGGNAEVQCPKGMIVTKCVAQAPAFGYCDGVTVKRGATGCEAYSTSRFSRCRAKACCGPLKSDETVAVISKPYDITRPFGSKKSYLLAPSVECPRGMELGTCLLNTRQSTNRNQVVERDGNKCSAPSTCDECAVQAVCVGEDPRPKYAPEFTCQEGEKKVVASQIVSNPNRVSSATCPDNHVVTKCECIVEEFDGGCSGAFVSPDGKYCTVYVRDWSFSTAKARACCRPLADGERPKVVGKSMLRDSGITYSSQAKLYTKAPSEECPEGSQLVGCFLHDLDGTFFSGPRMTGVSEGRKCSAPATCERCVVQAVCTGAFKKPETTRQCTEAEKEEISTDVVNKSGDKSKVTCPQGQVVTNCECVLVDGEGLCAGTSVEDGATTCVAHATTDKYKIKARACCSSLKAEMVVVTSRWAEDEPFEKCPSDSTLVMCLLVSLEHPNEIVRRDGDRHCWTTPRCTECKVQAVCSRPLPPKQKSEKCVGDDKEVISTDIVDKDDDRSIATCPEGSYVTKCECLVVSDLGYCDGVTVDSSKTECRAHGAKDHVRIKARACCGSLKEGEKFELLSDPDCMSDDDPTPHVCHSDYDYADLTVTCPEGSTLVTCLLHSYVMPRHPAEVAHVDGNRCYAEESCSLCGVQAICKTPAP